VASRVVYTAITGGHAQLSVRPEIPDTDFICFSDVPLLRADWQVRPIEAPSQLSPRMQAKFHKVFPPCGYEWSVWLDGAYVLDTGELSGRLVDGLVARSPGGLGLHRHHERDCIYAEARHSYTLDKCRTQRRLIRQQISHYRIEGHPTGWGLWGGGLLCRNESPRVHEIMRRWWDELLRWSWRDQLSLPFVLRSLGQVPDEWPWPLFQNPYVVRWEWNSK
jgi:Protein of unknown function (DUF616)